MSARRSNPSQGRAVPRGILAVFLGKLELFKNICGNEKVKNGQYNSDRMEAKKLEGCSAMYHM